MATKDDVQEALQRLIGAYPYMQITNRTGSEWYERLQHQRAELLFAATSSWIAREPRPPSIADLHREILTLTPDQYGPRKICSDPSCDGGWVLSDVIETIGDGRTVTAPVARPCATCRPEQRQIWASGHYRPNHDCGECAARRRGR